MTGIYAFLVAAYDLKFAGSFSLAELVSFLLILIAASRKKNYKLDFNSLLLLFFMFWLLVSTLDLNFEKYYSSSAFTNNMLRFSIYFLGFITLPQFFLNKERLTILFKNLIYATIIISIIGIIQFFLIQFNIKAEIRIANILTNKNSSLEIERITSVFSEPAHLSIYLGMILSLSFNFYKNHPKPKSYKYLVLLGALNLILATSLTGFLILMYLLFMMFYDRDVKKGELAGKLKSTFILLFVSFIVFIVVIQIDFLNDKIFERFYSVAEMDDGSANQRILGGFEFASNVLSEHPVTGIGLGQAASYYNSGNFVFANYWVGEEESGGGVNNIFISTFIQSGIVGLLLFSLFMVNLYKENKYLLFMCIIICFSWGYFNTPLFWFYFFISKAIQKKQFDKTHTPISKFKTKQIFI